MLIIYLCVQRIENLFVHNNVSFYCSGNTILNIVGHPDDDLLFLSPDLTNNIKNGKCVITIFLTSGDAGLNKSYWISREEGIKAAYSSLLNSNNVWVEQKINSKNNVISIFTQKNNNKISLIFLRLPDGSYIGEGYMSNKYESLKKLWLNEIIFIHSLDSVAKYSKRSLISTLLDLMNIYIPGEINTQDFIGNFVDGDHSDHYASAYLSYEAEKNYLKPHKIASYMDYAIESKPENVFGEEKKKKQKVFMAYATFNKKSSLPL